MGVQARFAMEGVAAPAQQRALQVPIDHAHLAKYTFGNKALEREVLQLFADQAPLTLDTLRLASCAKSWHAAAHTLKGSARAVGAWRLGALADAAEAGGLPGAARAHVLGGLEQAIDEVCCYIGAIAAA